MSPLPKLALSLFFAALAWNSLLVVVNRYEKLEGIPSDYATLYEVKDHPYIAKINLKNQKLHLQIEGVENGDSEQVELHLKEGLHDYQLPLADARKVHLTAEFVGRERYAKAGNSTPASVTVTSASLPIKQNIYYKASDWSDGYFIGEQELRLEHAQLLLDRAADLSECNNSKEKLLKITGWLAKEMEGRIGVPDDAADHMTGLELFEAATKGQTKVWCSQLSKIFAAFANKAGIPTREVFAIGCSGGIQFTGHAFTESWLNEEGRWAYVDLSSKTALVTDSKGRALNAAQLLHAVNFGGGSDFISHRFNGTEIEKLPWQSHAQTEHYYFGPNTSLIYCFATSRSPSFASKLLSYLFQAKLLYSLNPSSHQERAMLTLWSRRILAVSLLFALASLVAARKRSKRFV